jgi:mRNA interferase HigB
MDLINLAAIERFARKYRDAARWLANWIDLAKAADWQSIQDIRRQFPTADGVTLKTRVVVTVFNVKGNRYRLLTIISYAAQRVVIVDVLAHAEYDKENWK